MTAALPCVCTHLKPRHAGETFACRDCPCKRYEMDLQAAPATEADLDLDTLLERVRQQAAADNAEFQRVHGHCLGREAKLIGKVVDARNAGESTSARLRRVEQERDQANDLTDGIAAQLRLVTRERDALARRCAVRFEEK